MTDPNNPIRSDPGLSYTESMLTKILRIDRRLENKNTLAGVRRKFYRGSILERGTGALLLSLIFGGLLPLAIISLIANIHPGDQTIDVVLKNIYLFSAAWIFEDIGSFITISIALITAGLTCAIAVAAMSRAKYNADLEYIVTFGGFSRLFNLVASAFFAFHLALCLGWLLWHNEENGNISIFAPEVSFIGWILTLFLASLSVADIAQLRRQRDSLFSQQEKLKAEIDPDLDYRPLPLFNIANLSTTLAAVLITLTDAVLLMTTKFPKYSLLPDRAITFLLAAVILTSVTSWLFFAFTPTASPFTYKNKFLLACSLIIYSLICLSLGTISAGAWTNNSLAFLTASLAHAICMFFVPLFVAKSTIGKNRLLLARNNLLQERVQSLGNAIDRIDEKTSELPSS